MRHFITCVAVGSLFVSASAQAALTHRYDFSANANDLVGTANGTLVNTATVSGGKLQLNNPYGTKSSLAGYLSISPSVLGSSGSVTIEQWFTFTGSGFFTEAYAFTNSNNDANQPNASSGQYLMHTVSAPQPAAPVPPNTGGSHVGQTLAGYGNETDAFHTTPGIGAGGGGGYLDDGNTYMATTVINGAAGTLTYYINGIQQQTITAIPLSSYSFTNLFLGRSAFGVDNATVGAIDEFRVYDTPLGTANILADFAAGPDVVVAVPEPTTLAAAALAGLMLRRRR